MNPAMRIPINYQIQAGMESLERRNATVPWVTAEILKSPVNTQFFFDYVFTISTRYEYIPAAKFWSAGVNGTSWVLSSPTI